jgi:hypothetical protein
VQQETEGLIALNCRAAGCHSAGHAEDSFSNDFSPDLRFSRARMRGLRRHRDLQQPARISQVQAMFSI